MGSCFCFPVSSVTEDPSVVMYTEVGKAIISHQQSGIVMEASLFDGMVYVRGDRLYYNSKYGDEFWCTCTSGSDWFVSDIRNIEVITGDITFNYSNGLNRHISMNPGIRITFRDNTILMAAMPDAINFSLKLRSYQSDPSIRNRRRDYPFIMPSDASPPSLFKNRATTRPYHHAAPHPRAKETAESSEIPKNSEEVVLLA